MKVKIFWQEKCPNCPKARELGKQLENEITVQYFNVDSVDGLAEASYYDILATPSVVIVDKDDHEIKAWRGTSPYLEEIKKDVVNIEN